GGGEYTRMVSKDRRHPQTVAPVVGIATRAKHRRVVDRRGGSLLVHVVDLQQPRADGCSPHPRIPDGGEGRLPDSLPAAAVRCCPSPSMLGRKRSTPAETERGQQREQRPGHADQQAITRHTECSVPPVSIVSAFSVPGEGLVDVAIEPTFD